MLDSASLRRPLPYYGSYAGFYRAMWELKRDGIPRRIETGKFGPSVKNEASRVVSGLVALGWTDDVGRPNEQLKKLVDAFGTPAWGSVLAELLPKAYPYLANLDLETASNSDIKDAFVAHAGREGEALRNSETFFLCLAAEAGRPMSESFSRRAARGIGDAQRWLRIVQSEAGLGSHDVAIPSHHERRNFPKRRPTAIDLTSLLTDLAALLSDGDMTDEEKRGAISLVAYIGRKAKEQKE